MPKWNLWGWQVLDCYSHILWWKILLPFTSNEVLCRCICIFSVWPSQVNCSFYVMLGLLATILCSCIMKGEEMPVDFWKAMSAYGQHVAIPLLCLHLWKSPTGSCVFIWEVRSDVLPSDSMSLPSVLLFFIQGTESFLLGCIYIHALVSSLQSLPPCPSPWGYIWTGWMKVESSTALLFVVMLL